MGSYNGMVVLRLCFSTLTKVVGNELVLVLAPSEDVAPVAEIVGNDWKTVSPSLDDCLHVME
jgi:hypothetical protein